MHPCCGGDTAGWHLWGKGRSIRACTRGPTRARSYRAVWVVWSVIISERFPQIQTRWPRRPNRCGICSWGSRCLWVSVWTASEKLLFNWGSRVFCGVCYGELRNHGKPEVRRTKVWVPTTQNGSVLAFFVIPVLCVQLRKIEQRYNLLDQIINLSPDHKSVYTFRGHLNFILFFAFTYISMFPGRWTVCVFNYPRDMNLCTRISPSPFVTPHYACEL